MKYKKWKKWTHEDNELLKRLYLIEKMTVKETAEIMGRSFLSVKNHLYLMSIKKVERIPFIDAEDNFLRENHSKYRLAYLAQRLGRSISSVYNRIKFLKLRREK